jgi:hypothetical protein
MRLIILAASLLVALAVPARSQNSTPSDRPQTHTQHDERQMICKQMMAEHAADIQAISQALTTNLAQMKSTLAMINDINERSRWQANIAMWQAVADHFNHMAKHAEHMQAMGMGCGMMSGQGMGEHRDHQHAQPATPANPQ